MSLNHLIHQTAVPQNIDAKNLYVYESLEVNNIEATEMEVQNWVKAGSVITPYIALDGSRVYPWKLQKGELVNHASFQMWSFVDMGEDTNRYIHLKGSVVGGESAGIGYPDFYVRVYLPEELQAEYDFDTTKNFSINGAGCWIQGTAKLCTAGAVSTDVDNEGKKYAVITYRTLSGIVPEEAYTYTVGYDILYPVKLVA